jgi:hypothetical protein
LVEFERTVDDAVAAGRPEGEPERSVKKAIAAAEEVNSNQRKYSADEIDAQLRQEADWSQLASDSKFWDADAEQFTDAGFAEIDRLLALRVAEETNRLYPKITELSDLDHANHRAQAAAMDVLLSSRGIEFSSSGKASSKYFSGTFPDGEQWTIRFADHANTASDQRRPTINVAPDNSTFSEALAWVQRELVDRESTPPRARPSQSDAELAPIADQAQKIVSDIAARRTTVDEALAAPGMRAEVNNLTLGMLEAGERSDELLRRITAFRQADTGAPLQNVIADAAESLRVDPEGKAVPEVKRADPAAELAARQPDMEVEVDIGGTPQRMKAADAMKAIDEQAKADAADANLLQVAAECFLEG